MPTEISGRLNGPTEMAKRAAIYARVSTDHQTADNQLAELRSVADRHGWMVVHEFVDRGISGAKGRDQRPQLEALMKAVARREIGRSRRLVR